MQMPDTTENITSESKGQIEILSPTGRIKLGQFSLSDADDIFQLINESREHLSQHGDETATKYQTLDDIRESILNPKNPKRLRFAIREQGGKLVGSINLTPDTDNQTRGEIGYYLGSDAIGQGFATEATTSLSSFAFDRLGYAQLYAKVKPKNVASAKVLIRSGYEKTGEKDGELIFTLDAS